MNRPVLFSLVFLMIASGLGGAALSSVVPDPRPIPDTYGVNWNLIDYDPISNSLFLDMDYRSDPAWGVHMPWVVPIAHYEQNDQYYFGNFPEGEVITAVFKQQWGTLITLEIYGLDEADNLYLLQTITAQDIIDSNWGGLVPRFRG